MIKNSVIYFYSDFGFNKEPEFEPFLPYEHLVSLGLVPNEKYTQIIDLGQETDKQVTSIILWVENQEIINGFTHSHIFSETGRYLLIYFTINEDYSDLCLRIKAVINSINYQSNIFSCRKENLKSTSLISYRHKENLYGVPYTEFPNVFQQIRIPAYYQRLQHSAEAEITYDPGIIPTDNVSRIERTFKKEYTVIASDSINQAISCALDCDYTYLNKRRIIAEPYNSEQIEEGEWFSKSTLVIQELDELLNLEEFELVFNYRVLKDTLPDSQKINLTEVFNKAPSLINWGDGEQNNEVIHEYSQDGDYTIQIKIFDVESADFSIIKNIFEIVRLPETLNKINAYGCLFTAETLLKLFKLLNSYNPKEASITYPDITNSFFSKYVIVSSQQSPVIATDQIISEATQLIRKYWFVDYMYNISDKITTSRYLDPANYLMEYPGRHGLRIKSDKMYIFSGEEANLTMYVYLPSGTPWALYDFDCFVYPRLDIFKNEWELSQKGAYPYKADDEIIFELGILEKGFHKYRAVQQLYPYTKNYKISFDMIRTAERVIPVINRNETLVGTTGESVVTFGKQSGEGIFYGMYFSNIIYNGLGIVNPNGVFTQFFKNSTNTYLGILKNNHVIKIEEDGKYTFTFSNYMIDLSDIKDYFDFLSFRFVYIYNDNTYESNSINWYKGKITINKEITMNIPAGALVSPLIIGQVKPEVTEVTGKVKINQDSYLLIRKL